MSFVNEVEKHVPYEAPVLPQEAQFAQNMFQGLTGFMLQMGKKVIEWDRQDKLIEDHRKWQKEMFNLENAYNSPVAMAQRMRHAGLNPYAMTGQQVAGSFNSGSYPSTSSMEDPFDNLVKAAQISNINADTTKKEYDAEIAYQEARKKAIDADNFDEYWELTLAKLEEEGKLTAAQAEKAKAEAQKEFELARKAKEDADQFVDFGNSGGNVYKDASAESNARVEQINNQIDVATRSADREDKRLALDQYVAHIQALKTQAETAKITSETAAQNFYNTYIAPLDALNKSLINANLISEKEFNEARQAAVELENKLKQGEAQGFVTYLNYYLDKSLSAARIAVDAFL